VYQLSDVLNNTDTMLHPGMHVRVNLDVDISYEEATFIKETFVNTYKLREITLIPQKVTGDDISFDVQGNIMFESVDTIVTNQLTNIDSKQYNPKLLLDIYRNL
jgi:methylaspartate ammonia-lyase